jgi:hypothetical protein
MIKSIKNIQSENPLLAITPENQAVANNLMGIALQDLYIALRQRGVIDETLIFKEAEQPNNNLEEQRQQLQKIVALTEAAQH